MRIVMVVFVFLLMGCGPDCCEAPREAATVPEKRCGEDPQASLDYSPREFAALAECTVLVGKLQLDSIDPDEAFSGLTPLRNVRQIEGTLHVFRSAGYDSLHGLENLEVVEGFLFINQNPNLKSIEALSKLRSVTESLIIQDNPKLPQAKAEAAVACVSVGRKRVIEGNGL